MCVCVCVCVCVPNPLAVTCFSQSNTECVQCSTKGGVIIERNGAYLSARAPDCGASRLRIDPPR